MPHPNLPCIVQVCAVDFTARHFLLPLMRAQHEAGFEVHLACARGEFIAKIQDEGFEFHPVPFERSLNLTAHVRAYRVIKRLICERAFTVVHSHTPIAAMIARHAADACHTPLNLYTAHGFYFHDAMKPWKRRLHIGLERWAQRKADFLFTQSQEDAQTAVNEAIAPADRVLAIGNGVAIERFDRSQFDPQKLASLRREVGLDPADGPIVIMIGRLVREKGYFEFLEALAQLKAHHPRLRAVAIGKALESDHDASAGEIRQAAHALGLKDTVVFTGQRDDVPALLALGDVFCLPSWREGMPRSVIEAMAARLPVVATDIRGCREEVVEGKTGHLVAPRDARALAKALGELLEDPAKCRAMGLAGERRAREQYDERRVIARQMEVLRRLFAEKSLPWPG